MNETGPLLFLGAAPTTGLSYGYLIPGIPPAHKTWPGRAVVLLIEPPKTSRPLWASISGAAVNPAAFYSCPINPEVWHAPGSLVPALTSRP